MTRHGPRISTNRNITRRPLQFVVICLILTWPTWVVLGALGLDVDDGPAQLAFTVAACGPSLAALVLWLRFPRERLPARVRWSWRWPLIAVLLGAAAPLITAILLSTDDLSALPRHAAAVTAAAGGPLGVLGYTLLAGPVAEEFGWRGYLQPRLRTHLGRLWTAVLVGGVWSLWHFPLFLLPGTGQHEKGLFTVQAALFFVSWIPISYTILYVSEKLRGGVWAAVLAHSAFNVADALLPSTGDVGGYIQTALTLGVAGAVGLLWRSDDRRSRGSGSLRSGLDAVR